MCEHQEGVLLLAPYRLWWQSEPILLSWGNVMQTVCGVVCGEW